MCYTNRNMPIKRSILEQKWYYRIARVFFLVLPLVVIVILLKNYIDVSSISQDNIVEILQKNSTNIVYVVVGLVLYYLILKGIWRGFLYIAFGGLEDDITKRGTGAAQPSNEVVHSTTLPSRGALSEKDKKDIGFYVFILIMIILVYWIYSYQPINPGPNPNPNPNPNGGCIPTGCGSQWRCTGSYYDVSGIKRSINGCFSSGSRPSVNYSSWSGTCRQCP